MPLPGGASSKLGHRFEDRWTAHCALELLRERASAMRLEPPGPEGEGVEFWLRYPDRTEFHQVKRQRSEQAHWSITALDDASVLTTFKEKLQDAATVCVFVSTQPASSLDELGRHARAAVSYDEFAKYFLKGTSGKEFQRLCRAWAELAPPVVFERLRRIRTHSIAEELLTTLVSAEAETIIDGDHANLGPVLVNVLRDHVHHLLTAHELWILLAPGYRPNHWHGSNLLATRVMEANNRFISSRQDTLIGGQLMPRPEATTLWQSLKLHKVVLVRGAAGMGKSDVLLHLIENLATERTPYLAIRLDRVPSTVRPAALGDAIGLPTSLPTSLDVVAQGRQAVLIIDQLDVLSTTSGRSPEFLDCIRETIDLALTLSNLCIVLTCRTFDIETDSRLRRLVERSKNSAVVDIGLLDPAQVSERLEICGYDTHALTATQLELLRVPLHLALAAETSGGSEKLSFLTPRDLYDRFSVHKRHEVEARLGRVSAWSEILDRLVDDMSERQRLYAPHELVSRWADDVKAMVSARVLTRDGRQLAFFHETFFDYIFACSFIARRCTIQSLLSRDQLLFRRAQVRQILAQERESDFYQYSTDLEYLITSASVRFHLRDLTVSWLSQVPPTDVEWNLIAPLLLDETSPLHSRAWATLAAPDWLIFACGRGFIEQRLAADDRSTQYTLSILAQLVNTIPEDVITLLRPFASIPAWRPRISSLLYRADLTRNRALFDLFLVTVDDGLVVQSDMRADTLEHVAQQVAKQRPAWACELLGRYLDGRVMAAEALNIRNPFEDAQVIPGDFYMLNFLPQLGAAAPEAFTDNVFPTIVRIIERCALETDSVELIKDSVWRLRHFTEPHDFSHNLLLGIESAIQALAVQSPERFKELVQCYYTTTHEAVVYLLYLGFGANPQRFADDALDFIAYDTRRFRVAYSDDDYWSTRVLLSKVTSYASQDRLSELESSILRYRCLTERWIGSFGRAQFTLLSGIDSSRRSAAVRKRFGELQRQFGLSDAPGPYGVRGGWVQSPIPKDRASRMSDTQWLRAIQRYTGNRDARGHGRDFWRGGAAELANVLEEQTKETPERFAQLALRFDVNTNSLYYDAVLRGITYSEAAISLDLTQRLLHHCHELSNRPCGQWLGGILRRHARGDISEASLRVLCWYAINDPDPVSERADDASEGFTKHGLNCVRGAIARDIAYLVGADGERFAVCEQAIASLVTDRVLAVRAMATEIVLFLGKYYRDDAVRLFLQLVADVDDRLLTTSSAHEFLRYYGSMCFDTLRNVVMRMLRSDHASVRTRGAMQATMMALDVTEAAELANYCVASQDNDIRLGSAQVFAANLSEARFRLRCETALGTLFDDKSDDVRKTAGNAIWRLEREQLGVFEELARRFLVSKAFSGNEDDLIHALSQTTARVPKLIIDVCNQMLDSYGSGNRHGRLGYQAGQAIGLVLRAYADAHMASEKEAALDLVDRALQLDIYDANKRLGDFDRA